MRIRNPLTRMDFYKADHRRQYPKNTVKVVSNFTPRKSRIPGVNGVVFFDLQYVILSYLIENFNYGFFNKPKELVVKQYKRRMDNALGKDSIPVDHIEALHDLGYLPIKIKALPEGTICPLRVACFTIENTVNEFYWLVNYLETVLSNKIWKGCTSATIAFEYRKLFEKWYKKTVDDTGEGIAAVMWQGHDFSYRGMSGDEDAETSGAGHLLSFWGTDTVPAIDFLEDYYNADSDKEIIGGSVAATEHSVMCMGSKSGEFDTFRRLVTKLYPSGIVSIVSDTWDYWKVINEFLPALKNEILQRTGSPIGVDKVVIRPDSGDPYRIIVGYFENEIRQYGENKYFILPDGTIGDKPLTESEIKGSVQCLWDTFGGYETSMGFKHLSPKIGLIYGDSITYELAVKILEGLAKKGFASTNIVFGIGSFTYEYQTRDTFGFAMKATYGELEVPKFGEFADQGLNTEIIGREIFKDPKTDDGTKKSAKGLLAVFEDDEQQLYMKDSCTKEEYETGLLQTVFEDGKLLVVQSLDEIRKRLGRYL